MASHSRRVIFAALAGNTAIAVTKLAAALFTGSASMLSEAIHSVVDTGNQGLLLFGLRRAAKPADARHRSATACSSTSSPSSSRS